MASMMIKGTTVKLYEKTQTGVDEFNAPVYAEVPVEVENVLITPISSEDITGDVQLQGKTITYELSIPKGDTHQWENSRVDFFGQVYHSFGFVQEYIEDMIPLAWNKKVKVRRYG